MPQVAGVSKWKPRTSVARSIWFLLVTAPLFLSLGLRLIGSAGRLRLFSALGCRFRTGRRRRFLARAIRVFARRTGRRFNDPTTVVEFEPTAFIEHLAQHRSGSQNPTLCRCQGDAEALGDFR